MTVSRNILYIKHVTKKSKHWNMLQKKKQALDTQEYETLHLHKLRNIVDNIFQYLLQN